jgi:3-deoxy-manno-octulosonate cytidylyltransferase (CMP-KDO synthetase)
MTSAVVLIPARLASTRFPNKMLAADTGRPLVQHVVERVRSCRCVREIIVAADDPRIAEALRPFGTSVRLTSPDHPSGTDRIAEVARDLDDEIVVNVQGDEPEIEPGVIDELIESLQRDDKADMATAVTPFPAGSDPADPNLVKAVVGEDGRAVYFSRAPVPFHRDGPPESGPAHHLHLGLYAYRRPFLLEFASWSPTPLERAEKLEQLRALEHGRSIRVITVARSAGGIDTPQQYASFVRRFSSRSQPERVGV